jgi:hypothetical protein
MGQGKKRLAHVRLRAMEDIRSSWRSQWIELSDYMLPRRGKYLQESPQSGGRKRNTKIIDNTAGVALRTLAAGLMTGMTSPSRPWFRLHTEDKEMMKAPGVKRWLGNAEDKINSVLHRSGFYQSASEMYSELGAFGTGCLQRRPHPTDYVFYKPLTAGEYVIAEDEFGRVDTLGRDFQMTVRQAVAMFIFDPMRQRMDWSKGSRALQTLWDRGTYDATLTVLHLTQPRSMSERNTDLRTPTNRAFADLYFEAGADEDVFLRESGHDRFPYYTPRWSVRSSDIYGYSPGMDALGDTKQLQHQQKRKAQAVDKLVHPPMKASTALKGRMATTLPGGTTYVDELNGSTGFAPVYQIQPRLAEMVQDIQDVRARIDTAFYADLFAMMISSDRRQITATEVAERHEEKLVLLGPMLQRMNREFLDPIIGDLFTELVLNGQLGDPPEAIYSDGGTIKVRYVSLLAQAQEAVDAVALERTLGMAGNLAGIAPDIMDNIDTDYAIRRYGELLGNDPELMREEDDIAALREQRAEQAEQERQMAMAAEGAGAAQQGADAARLLSETDTQNPNALTSVLGAGQSLV